MDMSSRNLDAVSASTPTSQPSALNRIDAQEQNSVKTELVRAVDAKAEAQAADNQDKRESQSNPDVKQVEQAVSQMNDYVQKIQRDLNFQTDETSGGVVVTVKERSSGDVIRQIPSEEALQLAERLADMHDLLFSAKA